MIRILLLGIIVLIPACDRQNATTTNVQDTLHRVQFSVDTIDGPILSEARHKVYVERDSGRDLVFEGYGGTTVLIEPLSEGVVLLEYCGGAIRKVDSFISYRAGSPIPRAVTIQPIVIPNVTIGGMHFCSG